MGLNPGVCSHLATSSWSENRIKSHGNQKGLFCRAVVISQNCCTLANTVKSLASAHGRSQLKPPPKKIGGGPLHGEPVNYLLASAHPWLRQSHNLLVCTAVSPWWLFAVPSLLYKTRNGAYTSHHHFITFWKSCQSSSSTAPFEDFMSTSLAKSSPQFGRHPTHMIALQSPYGRVHALIVVKAWVGEIPRAPYVSTETIAHGTMSCDCG